MTQKSAKEQIEDLKQQLLEIQIEFEQRLEELSSEIDNLTENTKLDNESLHNFQVGKKILK
jgi:molecular chaperone GrpE (heat shock protein)